MAATAPQKPYSAAYRRAMEPYLAGTETAELLVGLALPLSQPRRATRVWVFNYPAVGLFGNISRQVDARGYVGFAFHERDKPSARIKRVKKLDRFEWLTVPEVYAIVHGGVSHRLSNKEIGEWSRKLLVRAGIREPEPEPTDQPKPAPRLKWTPMRIPRGTTAQGQLMHAIYTKLLVPDWKRVLAKARSSSGVPAPLRRSDAYLASALRDLPKSGIPGIEDLSAVALAQRVRRAMEKLLERGYIAAVGVVSEQYSRRRRVRAGYYLYMPGDGPPSKRHQQLQPRAVLSQARRLTDNWGLGVGPRN